MSEMPPSVHNAAGMVKADVTSEQWREYVYTDGFSYRIVGPETLYIKRKPDGDSHRVVDDAGVIHYIPTGWRALRWKNNPGSPQVDF